MSITEISALILGALGTLSGLWATWTQRQKGKAEAAAIYQRVATEVGERLSALESEVALYRATLNQWRDGIEQLHCQLSENGLTPVWTPPPIGDVPTQPRKKKA